MLLSHSSKWSSGLGSVFKRAITEEKKPSSWGNAIVMKWPEAQRGEEPTSVLTARRMMPRRSESRRCQSPPRSSLWGTPRPWTVAVGQNYMELRPRIVVSHGNTDHSPVLGGRGQNKHKAVVCSAEAAHRKVPCTPQGQNLSRPSK